MLKDALKNLLIIGLLGFYGGLALSQAMVSYNGGLAVSGPIGLLTDGGPLPTKDAADNANDAGAGPTVIQVGGLTTANGTQPTAAPAGVSLMPAMNQDGRQYCSIAPPDPISYYASTSSEALVVVAPATGTSYYITDYHLSAGTTAQELKLLDCDAGTIVVYADDYLPANGGESSHQITPIKIVAGKSVCCDPVGSTTATCTTQGYVAP